MKRCLPVLLFLLSVSAHGALNKWVDAEGNVHYSDEPPPPDVKAQALAVPSAARGAHAQKTVAEREAEWKKSKKAEEEAAQKAAQQQEISQAKQKNCAGAQSNLKTLESSSPIATYNDKGERVNMDDAARRKNIEDARKQIGIYCD